MLKARFFFRNRWPAELISPPGGLFPSDQKFRFQNCLIRGSRSELSFGKQPIFVLFWSLSSLTGATAIAAASEEVFLVFPLSEIVVVELEQNWMSSTLTGVLELDTPSHTDSYPSIAISCIKFQQFTKFSSFTYEQLEIAFLKHGNWSGNSSWEAERRAEAAIIDGLNSNSLMSFCALKMISVALALRA